MRYDRHGFPIPPDFEVDSRLDDVPSGSRAAPTATGPKPPRAPATGSRKRFVIVALAAAVILPAILLPEVAPAIRQMVVEWSLEQEIGRAHV